MTAKDFSTVRPAFADPGLEGLLKEHGVIINASSVNEPRDPLLTLLISFGPTLLLIGGVLWLSRQAGRQPGGPFGLGKSQAKRYDAAAGTDRVTFDDVAGIDEAEEELVEVVDFLKHSQKYTRLGGRVPKGVLLVGPPGTGRAKRPPPSCSSTSWTPSGGLVAASCMAAPPPSRSRRSTRS